MKFFVLVPVKAMYHVIVDVDGPEGLDSLATQESIAEERAVRMAKAAGYIVVKPRSDVSAMPEGIVNIDYCAESDGVVAGVLSEAGKKALKENGNV